MSKPSLESGRLTMFGATQAYPLGSKRASIRSILRRIRVGQNLELPHPICPTEYGKEIVIFSGWEPGHFAEEDLPGTAIERDDISFLEPGSIRKYCLSARSVDFNQVCKS